MRRRHQNPFSLFSFQDIITGLCGLMVLFVLIMVMDITIDREVSRAAAIVPEVQEADPEPRAPFLDFESVEKLREEIDRLKAEQAELQKQASELVVSPEDPLLPEEAAAFEAAFGEQARAIAAVLSQIAELERRLKEAKAEEEASREARVEMERTCRRLEGELNDLRTRMNGVTLIPERGMSKIPVYLILSGREVELIRPLKGEFIRKTFSDRHWEDQVREVLAPLNRGTHTIIILVRPSGLSRMSDAVDLAKDLHFTYGRDPLEEDKPVSVTEVDRPEGVGK